jgi:hypothetical protein
MNNPQPTVKTLFGMEGKHAPQDVKTKIEKAGQVTSLREKISTTLGKTVWPNAFDEISKKSIDLLDINLIDVLVGAWNKYQGLRKYLDREKYSPTQSVLVPLGEHTVKSEHQPYVEVLINDEVVARITFHVALAFTVRGVLLLVQDGRIKSVKTGEIKGKGTVKCEEALLLEQDFRTVSLPGTVDLGEGIRISE